MAFPSEVPRRAFRIADIRYPIFDGTGAMRFGGRWNSPGRRVIYASETFAGAMLEILVHATGGIPKSQACVEIRIPLSLAVETLDTETIPGWDQPDSSVAKSFGDRWLADVRSPILVVPSVVVQRERNIVINPDHPDFHMIEAGKPELVRWDDRLLGRHRALTESGASNAWIFPSHAKSPARRTGRGLFTTAFAKG